jgi:hypothetical protein
VNGEGGKVVYEFGEISHLINLSFLVFGSNHGWPGMGRLDYAAAALLLSA